MKKILILLLAVAMLLPIVACQQTGTNDPQTSQTESTGGTQGDTTGDDLELGLPNLKLNGYTMTMLRSSHYFTEHGVWSEEEISGDHVSEAVYKRNVYIEDTYDCDIDLLPTNANNPTTEIDKYVSSGDGAVDVMFDGAQKIMAMHQNFVDLNQLEYFDFSKPWWNHAFNEGVSLGDKLFLTIGSYGISARKYTYHILFDFTVAEDVGIEPKDLYQLVYDDEWTIDVMTRHAQTAKKDLNGDSVMDTNDRYGLIGQMYNNWTLSLGSGVLCVEKDENDLPVVILDTDRNRNASDAIKKLTEDATLTLYAERMTGVDGWATLRKLETSSGQWLFLCGALDDYMRTNEKDFGVLPTPKYDEAQERYYHDASLGNSPTTAIPISATEPDKASFILEAMSYYSYKDVLPTFYENYQNTKLARDEQSIDMLQIIHDSIYYDIGAIFNWGGMGSLITKYNLNAYDSIRDKVYTEMNATLESMGIQ